MSGNKSELQKNPIGKDSADSGADKTGKNLERAIIIGTVLIFVLVAAVFYLKFAAWARSTDGSSNQEIQTPTHD